MPQISVILPVYNEEKYLEQCLQSICIQTLKEIEIICVDDGSTDRSLEILQKYAKKDDRIRVLTQKNQFAGAARNYAMKDAAGKYLSFLDADDYFEPDMLEKLYQKAEKTEADIVICRYEEYCEEDAVRRTVDYSFEDLFFKTQEQKAVFSGQALNLAGIFQIAKGWAWDKLFRADFVRKCSYRFSDFRSSEDGFFVYMLLARAARISYTDDVLAVHRINNSSSLSNNKDNEWINGFKMWQMIAAELKKQNLYQVYEQSFLNELVYFLSWYLDSMNLTETVQSCRYYIKSVLEPEFQILAYGSEKFFQEELFEWYRELVTD